MDYSDSNKFEVAQFNLKNQFPFAAFVCERRGNVSTLVTTVNSVVKHVTDDLPVGSSFGCSLELLIDLFYRLEPFVG